MRGADTLYNSYWVRFDYKGLTYEKAVENTRVLVDSAVKAKIRKIVLVSIAEFVFSLPPDYLMGGAETKRLLRRALRGILPDPIRERWNKQGFRPPQENWFKGALLAHVRATVNDPAFAARGLWDAAWWRAALRRFEQGESHLAWTLWMPTIVEAWFRHFVDRAKAQSKQSVFS